ncbi:MAG TPA: hypothetical protein VFP89_15545 [Propionibacteriaceae bacterium]|nr:hypothetical protein [Propionibacteriaceae bacterium]
MAPQDRVQRHAATGSRKQVRMEAGSTGPEHVLQVVVDEENRAGRHSQAFGHRPKVVRVGLGQAELARVELPVKALVVAELGPHMGSAPCLLVRGQAAEGALSTQLADGVDHVGVDIDPHRAGQHLLDAGVDAEPSQHVVQRVAEVDPPSHRRTLGYEDLVEEAVAFGRRARPEEAQQRVAPSRSGALHHAVSIKQDRRDGAAVECRGHRAILASIAEPSAPRLREAPDCVSRRD